MELKKIRYSSATFFGIAALVMYFVRGLMQLIIVNRFPEYTQALFGEIVGWQVLILLPAISAFVVYLVVLLLIYIYNMVAKKYPVSWELRK